MSPYRYRDEGSSVGDVLASLALGALAGFAVGVVVAQKVGGIAGITSRLRARFSELAEGEDDETRGGYEYDEIEDYGEDELEDDEMAGADVALEERVLEAFKRDPVLSERAIDIGALGEGVIELSGWVDADDESEHATEVAGSVAGVDTVVNRLLVGDEDMTEEELDRDDEESAEASDASEDIDTENPNAPLPGGRWEGNRVGTGRRRQGTSDEADRHADPKPVLEERWLDEQHAVEEAAGDIEGIAERRRRRKAQPKGDRSGGSPIAPTGVPKADHVREPEAEQDRIAREEDTGPRD